VEVLVVRVQVAKVLEVNQEGTHPMEAKVKAVVVEVKAVVVREVNQEIPHLTEAVTVELKVEKVQGVNQAASHPGEVKVVKVQEVNQAVARVIPHRRPLLLRVLPVGSIFQLLKHYKICTLSLFFLFA